MLLRQFRRWRGDCPVNEITPAQIRDWLQSGAARGLTSYSRRRQLAVVSAMYRWLTSPEINLAAANPASAVAAPKLPDPVPKAISRADIQKLLETIKTLRNKRRARAIILFLLDTGTRATELCLVQLADLDLKIGKVLVTGKGNKQRYVYLGSQARSALWLYITAERPEPRRINDDSLFLTDDGYPLTRYSLRRIITRLAKSAGVKATPHQFRHTAAIERLRNGMDLVSLQHLLGHADITTTRRYLTALRDEDVEHKARRTSPADNWRL